MSLPCAAEPGRYRLSVLLLLIALCAPAGMTRLAYAQRDDIVVDANSAAELQNIEPRRVFGVMGVGAVDAPRRGVSNDTIYQWVFGTSRNAEAATKQLEAKLRAKVEELVLLRRATEEQKKKLELAGQVDIRRLLERVDDLLRQGQEGKHDLNRVNEVHRQAVRLGQSLNTGLFNEGSFFGKTARHIFTSQQIDETQRQRIALEHRAHVERAVVILKDPLRMTDQQQRSLVALLLAETRPPPRPEQYGFQVALFDMKRLPENKLKPLFSDAQWDLLQRQFEQVQWLEPYLKQNGFLHEAEPVTSKP